MAVTLRDVAARAGVSVSAASHVLRGYTKAGIKPETQERVRQAAREIGYRPSAVARALVRRQTDTLGILLPLMDDSPMMNPFFGTLLNAVLRAAATFERDTMVFTARQTWEAEESLDRLLSGRCDGLILFYQYPASGIISALLDAAAPCVLVGDWREDPRLPCVDIEHREAMRSIAGHLLDLGHARVALLATQLIDHYVPPRVAGFHDAFTERDLTADESLIVMNLRHWEPLTVIAAVDALMDLPPSQRPTALCCIQDDIAGIAVAALGRRGLRVPEDVSVTGFNDDGVAISQHPPLTTVRQPYAALGKQAVGLLLQQIEGLADPASKIRLPAELVVRGTTTPPRT